MVVQLLVWSNVSVCVGQEATEAVETEEAIFTEIESGSQEKPSEETKTQESTINEIKEPTEGSTRTPPPDECDSHADCQCSKAKCINDMCTITDPYILDTTYNYGIGPAAVFNRSTAFYLPNVTPKSPITNTVNRTTCIVGSPLSFGPAKLMSDCTCSCNPNIISSIPSSNIYSPFNTECSKWGFCGDDGICRKCTDDNDCFQISFYAKCYKNREDGFGTCTECTQLANEVNGVTGFSCPEGKLCQPHYNGINRCVDCSGSSDCINNPNGNKCLLPNYFCGCNGNGDCPSGKGCDLSTRLCVSSSSSSTSSSGSPSTPPPYSCDSLPFGWGLPGEIWTQLAVLPTGGCSNVDDTVSTIITSYGGICFNDGIWKCSPPGSCSLQNSSTFSSPNCNPVGCGTDPCSLSSIYSNGIVVGKWCTCPQAPLPNPPPSISGGNSDIQIDTQPTPTTNCTATYNNTNGSCACPTCTPGNQCICTAPNPDSLVGSCQSTGSGVRCVAPLPN